MSFSFRAILDTLKVLEMDKQKETEMEKRYSEMSEFELRQEISFLNEKAKKAEQMGMVNEFAVYERKMLLAKAYLLDESQFEAGKTYEVDEEEKSEFFISYMNGKFAWGYRNGSSVLEGIPISLLKTIE